MPTVSVALCWASLEAAEMMHERGRESYRSHRICGRRTRNPAAIEMPVAGVIIPKIAVPVE
jgi:hypothetical protein